MKFLPKSISPVTLWGGLAIIIIVGLIALGPGDKYAISFLLPLAGPFGFIFFLSGLNDWIPQPSNISFYYFIKVASGAMFLGVGCLLMILSHSYKRSGGYVLLTLLGYFLWLLFGLSITYVSV